MSDTPPQPGQTDPNQPQAPLQHADLAQAGTTRKGFFRRHKVLTGLGALVVLGIVVGAASGGGDPTPAVADDAPAVSTTQHGQDPSDATTSQPGIGDAVRDGKFEFTVTKVAEPVSELGDEYLSTTAQGEFLVVHLTIENIGNEAQSFFGDNQKLVDTQGRTFSADTTAAIYVDDASSMYAEVNPGNTMKGVVVFDVPTGTVPASLELHDSAFSGGVTVALR